MHEESDTASPVFPEHSRPTSPPPHMLDTQPPRGSWWRAAYYLCNYIVKIRTVIKGRYDSAWSEANTPYHMYDDAHADNILRQNVAAQRKILVIISIDTMKLPRNN